MNLQERPNNYVYALKTCCCLCDYLLLEGRLPGVPGRKNALFAIYFGEGCGR